MGHLVCREPWGVLDFYLEKGVVFVRQDWHYQWLTRDGMPPWTGVEKHAFHKVADRQIWGVWSNRFTLGIRGSSAVAQKFRGREIPVNFDVRWVLNPRPAHWTVEAWKVKEKPRRNTDHAWPKVRMGEMTIVLNTMQMFAQHILHHGHPIAAHEFGHTLGAPAQQSFLMDEYNTLPGLGLLEDRSSIMNLGSEVRQRHIFPVTSALNKMIKNTTFDFNATRVSSFGS